MGRPADEILKLSEELSLGLIVVGNHGAGGRLSRMRRFYEPIATLDLAYYEVTNVAIRAWGDSSAARRLREMVAAIADDGGLVRADEVLVSRAADLAARHALSVYDAAYVAAASAIGARLVSCDMRDLVSAGLVLSPTAALVS